MLKKLGGAVIICGAILLVYGLLFDTQRTLVDAAGVLAVLGVLTWLGGNTSKAT